MSAMAELDAEFHQMLAMLEGEGHAVAARLRNWYHRVTYKTPQGSEAGTESSEDQTVPLHPAVADLLRYLEYSHLPEHLQDIARPFHELGHDMARRLTGPQLSHGLFDLIRAKDCCVRAALDK